MDRKPIAPRAAKPTLDEGLVYARYLDVAAEGFFRLMLGSRASDIVATAYSQPNNNYSYQHVTFAERDNVIVGMVSGFRAEQRRGFTEEPLKRAAGDRHMRLSIVFERGIQPTSIGRLHKVLYTLWRSRRCDIQRSDIVHL